MITCPWCGTNYAAFQSNCQKCGGPMPIPIEPSASGPAVGLPQDRVTMPPPPPRPIDNRYMWRCLVADGWAIAAFVFGLLGMIFTWVGAALTLGVITAFVGIPFIVLGLLFLGGGAGVAGWRYQEAQKMVQVWRTGAAAEGQIVQVAENQHVRVNARHPWVIRYQFGVGGQIYEGQVSTLNLPGIELQPGRQVCVLYLPQAPGRNVLYPQP